MPNVRGNNPGWGAQGLLSVAGGSQNGNMSRDEVRDLLWQPGYLNQQLRTPEDTGHSQYPTSLVAHIFWNKTEEDAKLKRTLA